MQCLDKKNLANFLSNMDKDNATDILKEFEQENREEILREMELKDANILLDLVQFDHETAGGMMTPKFNKILPDQSAASILMAVKKEKNHEHYPYFYVLNNHNKLLGYFKLRDLLHVSPETKAITFIRSNTPKVQLDDQCDKVTSLMTHEHLSVIPVVDKNNVMLGIITFDDVFRVMQDIANEEIFTMVGTTKFDPFSQKLLKKILTRLPWLLTTFAGGILGAIILRKFRFTLAEYSAVIFFIPFVLGLAGNIGIQGSTLIVRGLATGDIKKTNLKRIIAKEITVGCLNGVIFGIISGLFVFILSKIFLDSPHHLLGIIICTGVILSVCGTALIGTFSPIFFMKFNIDPAISAGPFITVTNDVIGLSIYLSIATLILTYFS